ncbi:MAG: HEAT repeat domain-containing protein [Nitrospinae bacterium]|nr:HEAT repeat domain-containing protein [Nitrospinota bacterium]
MNGQSFKNNRKYEEFSRTIVTKLKELKSIRKENVSESIMILQTGDDDARWMAAEVLGEIGGMQAIDSLISALNTESLPDVKLAILDALSGYTDEEKVLNAIRSIDNDNSPAVREEAKEIINQTNIFWQLEDKTIAESESIEPERIVKKVRKHLIELSQIISEQIAVLTQTPNLAGATLNKMGARLHIHRESIECPELAEFGYEPSLLSKTELDGDTLKATIQVFKGNNPIPIPIDLIFKAGDIEEMQTLGKEKQRAEFVFKYKKDQPYEIYISTIKEKGIETEG